MNVHEFPCMYCGLITKLGCPECGAACCVACGTNLCPLCIRIRSLQTELAMIKPGVSGQRVEMLVSPKISVHIYAK